MKVQLTSLVFLVASVVACGQSQESSESSQQVSASQNSNKRLHTLSDFPNINDQDDFDLASEVGRSKSQKNLQRCKGLIALQQANKKTFDSSCKYKTVDAGGLSFDEIVVKGKLTKKKLNQCEKLEEVGVLKAFNYARYSCHKLATDKSLSAAEKKVARQLTGQQKRFASFFSVFLNI